MIDLRLWCSRFCSLFCSQHKICSFLPCFFWFSTLKLLHILHILLLVVLYFLVASVDSGEIWSLCFVCPKYIDFFPLSSMYTVRLELCLEPKNEMPYFDLVFSMLFNVFEDRYRHRRDRHRRDDYFIVDNRRINYLN